MCRRSGLEKRRRCGWLGAQAEALGPPVWVRKGVAIESCPKYFITAESEAWLEEFLVWRRLGGRDARELSARQVEAFAILEREHAAEMKDGQQNTRAGF